MQTFNTAMGNRPNTEDIVYVTSITKSRNKIPTCGQIASVQSKERTDDRMIIHQNKTRNKNRTSVA